MENNQLNQMQALYNAVAFGTWQIEENLDDTADIVADLGEGTAEWIAGRMNINKARFIVAAHAFVPAALKKLRPTEPIRLSEVYDQAVGDIEAVAKARSFAGYRFTGYDFTNAAEAANLLPALLRVIDDQGWQVNRLYAERASTPTTIGEAAKEYWSPFIERARQKGMDNYQQVAADMLLGLLADTKEGEHTGKVCDLIAGIMVERDHDVKSLNKEIKRLSEANPAPACTCLWKAGHDRRCPAYDAYVEGMDAASSSPVIQQADKWVSVEERLPEADPADRHRSSMPVLIYLPKGPDEEWLITKAFYSYSGECWEHCLSPMGWPMQEITHWMALPSAPATPSKEEKGGPDGE